MEGIREYPRCNNRLVLEQVNPPLEHNLSGSPSDRNFRSDAVNFYSKFPNCQLPADASLGGLQWIELLGGFLITVPVAYVGGIVTATQHPLGGGVPVGITELPGGFLDDMGTTLASLYDGVAFPSVKRAALLLHENAFGAEP